MQVSCLDERLIIYPRVVFYFYACDYVHMGCSLKLNTPDDGVPLRFRKVQNDNWADIPEFQYSVETNKEVPVYLKRCYKQFINELPENV